MLVGVVAHIQLACALVQDLVQDLVQVLVLALVLILVLHKKDLKG